MNKKLLLLSLCATAVYAQPQTYTYPKGQQIKALIHPYAKNGNVGRTSGMFDHYRPQFRPGGKFPDVTCQLVLSSKDHEIAPGTTEEAALLCNEAVTLTSKETKYTIAEGGRVVGEAIFLWPLSEQKP